MQASDVYRSGWTITSQVPGTQVSDLGQIVAGITVGFRTGDGVVGTVFVPDAQFNPAYVQAQVDAKAAQIDAVSKLQGQPSQ